MLYSSLGDQELEGGQKKYPHQFTHDNNIKQLLKKPTGLIDCDWPLTTDHYQQAEINVCLKSEMVLSMWLKTYL